MTSLEELPTYALCARSTEMKNSDETKLSAVSKASKVPFP